jgi:hypothetical protein
VKLQALIRGVLVRTRSVLARRRAWDMAVRPTVLRIARMANVVRTPSKETVYNDMDKLNKHTMRTYSVLYTNGPFTETFVDAEQQMKALRKIYDSDKKPIVKKFVTFQEHSERPR